MTALYILVALLAGISLQQGTKYDFNGEHCTAVEITLKDASERGDDGWSVNLSLIPPLAYFVKTGFKYTNGCTSGAVCGDANCNTAFHTLDQTFTQVACQALDVSGGQLVKHAMSLADR
ncbi:hypothetical protein C8R43DRAFT_1237031 [Mycena crocata]|nr:hypothetical protein C8R43DRAFT_1237031 [Mycena crocata]